MKNKILEILWLIVAAISLATLLHALISKGIREGIPFFIIFVFSLLFFLMRKNRRRKLN